MNIHKADVLKNICYTELVYVRINKKLNSQFSKEEIEKLLLEILKEIDQLHFRKAGKNIYVTNKKRNIRITINSGTNRIITVDDLSKPDLKIRVRNNS